MNSVLEKIKYFIFGNLYLFLFIFMQIFAMFAVFILQIIFNKEFSNQFMNIMNELTIENNSISATGSLINLLEDIMNPILLLSNILIVIIILIKMYLCRNTEKLIDKIKFSNVSKYLFFGVALNLIISFIISYLPSTLIESHSEATSFALEGVPILLILSSGLFAPIAEELIFRYGIQKNFMKINIYFGLIAQAFLFGLVHGNLVQGTYAFIIGLIFGIVDYKCKNVAYSIFMHIGVNMSSVLIYLIPLNEYLSLILIITTLIFISLGFKTIENKK